MAYEGYGFELVELDPGPRATLYTVQFDRSTRTEFAGWAYDEDIQAHNEYDTVFGSFKAIASEGLPDDCYFKRRGYDDYGWITPFISSEYHPELRLYCIYSPDSNHDWVIAGNGCIKDGPEPIRDFPECAFPFKNVIYVHRRVRERMETEGSPELHSTGKSLAGNFRFDPDPQASNIRL